MDLTPVDAAPWRVVLLVLIPLAYVVAAFVGTGWRPARLVASVALGAAALSALALAVAGPLVAHGPLQALWGAVLVAALFAPASALVPGGGLDGATLVLAFVASLALVPLLLPLFGAGAWRGTAAPAARLLGGAALVAVAYAGLHHGLAGWAGAPASSATVAQLAIVVLGFGALFTLQGWVRARPDGALARRLYPWCYGGLFLDELFTRATFRLWPAPRVATPGTTVLVPPPGVP